MHMGTPEQGDAFFDDFWPAARAVADAERRLYEAFGRRRGSLREVLGPGVLLRGLGAAARGHLIGRVIGDPAQLGGTIVVEAPRVLWRHDPATSADHPDWAAIPRLIEPHLRTPDPGEQDPERHGAGP